jgi:dihydropteroate synthase-like protein
MPERVLLVTGRLAEPSLRRLLEQTSPPFAWDVAVMKITVAALMTTEWIGRFLTVPEGTSRVLIPGLCEGDTAPLSARLGVRVDKGPDDLRELPHSWGRPDQPPSYGPFDIEIAAEINNVPTLDSQSVYAQADYFRRAGADIIDVGCSPGVAFPALHDLVRGLVAAGHRVSIDSFDSAHIRTAVDAGATLVFSVNGSNLGVLEELAGRDVRVVAVPDPDGGLESLEPTLDALERHRLRYLIDPILQPIGHGFTASLERYVLTRRRYPEAEMLMGVGNLTELTAADTTGVNAVLLAICQELGIRTVLTTEVTPWARGAVRELDIARRLMHYAITEQTIPKRVDNRLLTVKDPSALPAFTEAELRRLQATLTDTNFRIFVDANAITVLNSALFVRDTDAQRIFAQLGVTDAAHAFYLGAELARAELAMQLGKTYRQDRQLNWGYLTAPEKASTRVRLTGPVQKDDHYR